MKQSNIPDIVAIISTRLVIPPTDNTTQTAGINIAKPQGQQLTGR